MDASTIPRWGLTLTPPRPRAFAEWLSTVDSEDWPPAPAGDGRPVMLIPGFMAGDQSLTRMATWLRTGGYVLVRSGIRWNSGCMEPTVESVERRLERAVRQTGKRALIVGQSRGGCIGRALTALRPDLVETLVTLGAPLLDQLAVRPRVWPSILTVGTLGTFGVPGMFSISCLNGSCCARTREAMTGPFPDDIRFSSIYSPNDEIVRWKACLDEAASHIEVDVSHIGMGWARDVWLAVTDAIGRAVDATG